MASAIKLSEAELTKLFGLPHLSIVLYVMGIRPRMDFKTATVGERPLISWQALREAVYIEPHAGVKHEYASMDQLRRAAVWLEKAGLIKMRSRERQLIFFLPLAFADLADNHAQNKAARGTPDKAAICAPDANPHGMEVPAYFDDEARQIKTEKAASHPVSGKNKTLPPTPRTDDSTGKTPKEEGGQEGESHLIFPKSITAHQKGAIANKLQGMGVDMAQTVLDELAGYIQAGTVKNMPRLLAFFVEQVGRGEFIPDKGESIRKGREVAERAREMARDAERRAQAEREAAFQNPAIVQGALNRALSILGSRKRSAA